MCGYAGLSLLHAALVWALFHQLGACLWATVHHPGVIGTGGRWGPSAREDNPLRARPATPPFLLPPSFLPSSDR